MALIKTFMIGVTLVCGMLTGAAWGQNHTPGTFFERTPENAQNLPLATPGMFDYDAQVFAPLEFTNGKNPDPNTGLFCEFSKTYTSLERSPRFDTLQGRRTGSGTEWYPGAKYVLGYYGEEDRGWNASFAKTEGTFRFNQSVETFAGTSAEGNIRLTTVDLNRTFRQQTSDGGLLEPSFGIRYNWMRDRLIDNSLVGGATNEFVQLAQNTVFGVQAGARYSKRRGRWRFTCHGNAAATYNQQSLFASSTSQSATVITFNDATFSDQSFVPILDGSLEATYNFTRDLSLKFGAQGSYIWSGVLRADAESASVNPLALAFDPSNVSFDENYVAAGIILGLEFRR